MVECVSTFFAGKKSASISDVYNQNAGSGSAKKEAVRKRLSEIEKHYDGFFLDNDTDEAVSSTEVVG